MTSSLALGSVALGRNSTANFCQREGRLVSVDRGQHRAVAADQVHIQTRRAVQETHFGGEIIRLPVAHADAAKALVGNAKVRLALRMDANVVRIARIKAVVIADGQLALGHAGADLRPAHHRVRELEAAIFHQLRVEAAVGAKIDVLEEYAPHGRIDFRAGAGRFGR